MTNLTNLFNTFTVFGNFLVFDEDIQPVINKVYTDCDISIKHEESQANPSGKLMIINDQRKHQNITLRPNRIDIQIPNIIPGKEQAMLKDISDIFNSLNLILENPDVTRIAVVQNFFVFDDNKENLARLIKTVPFVDSSLDATEIQFRTNTPLMIGSELINFVTNINTTFISENKKESRNSLMFSFDVNTNHQNLDPRFSMSELQEMYESMLNIINNKLMLIEETL